MNAVPPAAAVGWQARLELDYSVREQATVLSRRRHRGPLVVQKSLYPEGRALCHTLLLHPPGGICGGDELDVNLRVGADSQVLITTPGAGKWYRSSGACARQRISAEVRRGAVLEWMPQEAIVFDGARVHMELQVCMEPSATFFGWDMVCLGRHAAGERFRQGALRQHVDFEQAGLRLFSEAAVLRGDDPLFDSPLGLAGRAVYGTLWLAGPEIPAHILGACRAIETAAAQGDCCGVTALPQLLAARYVGHSAERGRNYFVQLWAVLRPWYARRAAHPPRIWQT